jgi:NAD(P)-dependent dehydrogenase (short-subunit alcohol dehydrogenase family)
MNLNLEGQVALVTGATGGLGGAVAHALAGEGMTLVLTGRDESKLLNLARDLRSHSGRDAITHRTDLTLLNAAYECVEAAVAASGRLDLVVNCAGATRRGDFFTLSDRDWQDGFALKFHACVRICRAAWPHLARQAGSVINIVGIGSRTPSQDFLIGGSVNNALLNFTKGLADRGMADGVRVNAVNPGYFHTDRTGHRLESIAARNGISLQEAEVELLAELGIPRFGRPEEVGTLVAFLASSESAYIHGSTLDVDGGATRGL